MSSCVCTLILPNKLSPNTMVFESPITSSIGSGPGPSVFTTSLLVFHTLTPFTLLLFLISYLIQSALTRVPIVQSSTPGNVVVLLQPVTSVAPLTYLLKFPYHFLRFFHVPRRLWICHIIMDKMLPSRHTSLSLIPLHRQPVVKVKKEEASLSMIKTTIYPRRIIPPNRYVSNGTINYNRSVNR